MQAMSYDLNPSDAREGSGPTFSKVDRSGKYVGEITKAIAHTFDSGALGIEFDFKSSCGAVAQRVRVCTHNRNSEPTYGNKQVQAIMACLKRRNAAPENAVIEVYDFDAKQKVNKDVVLYRGMMGPIGMVIQMEEIEFDAKQGKKRVWLAKFVAPFNAETGQVAAEILDDRPAETAERIGSTIKDKPLPASNSAPASQPNNPMDMSDFDDDIPF